MSENSPWIIDVSYKTRSVFLIIWVFKEFVLNEISRLKYSRNHPKSSVDLWTISKNRLRLITSNFLTPLGGNLPKNESIARFCLRSLSRVIIEADRVRRWNALVLERYLPDLEFDAWRTCANIELSSKLKECWNENSVYTVTYQRISNGGFPREHFFVINCANVCKVF